jgi:acyl transferase domain-containing protein
MKPLDGSSLPRREELLLLSAPDEAALAAAARRLAEFLAAHPEAALPDVAAALRRGRDATFNHRRMVVCSRRGEAIAALGSGAVPDRGAVPAAGADGGGGDVNEVPFPGASRARAWSSVAGPPPAVSFLLSGVGDQYPGMARGLYAQEPVFRHHLDRCAEILLPWIGSDLREALLPPPPTGSGAAAGPEPPGGTAPPRADLRQLLGRAAAAPAAPSALDRTLLLHPAIFSVEYALAKLWLSWGIVPRSLLGYSVGEYVAACLAGIFELEAALRLVAVRARLIDALPPGAMLSLFLSEAETVRRLGTGLSLAAVNGPTLCVVAGLPAAVAELEDELRRSRIPSRRLAAGHAFHSALLEPVVEPLVREVAAAGLRRPALPLVSNVTGGWITAADAVDPRYWARHMCRTVRFAAGAATLCAGPPRVLVEIGPGSTLCSMVLQAALPVPPLLAVPSLPHAHDPEPDTATVLTALGKLWLAGVEPDWEAFQGARTGDPLSLPMGILPASAPRSDG